MKSYMASEFPKKIICKQEANTSEKPYDTSLK